ncbi:c-5 sterol desaturase [Podila clonocystis]|nr:c-5 sterol desaturase [Podila clonocystis]
MDEVLAVADELLFNSMYQKLPSIPIPDLALSLQSLPSMDQLQSLASSSSSSIFSTFVNTTTHAWQAGFSGLTLDTLPADHLVRQALSLFLITFSGAFLMYFSFAIPAYYFLFDHNYKSHPKYLKNQVRLEIDMSVKALLGIAVFTTPWMVASVRGYSRLYSHIHSIPKAVFNPPATPIQESMAATITAAFSSGQLQISQMDQIVEPCSDALACFMETMSIMAKPLMDGWGYVAVSIVLFVLFTDFGIYWAHRVLHHPLLYKRFHKPHHKWVVPTPFASHAFHFVDGYIQSLPYQVVLFVVPLHKYVYFALFSFVNLWTVLIHDNEFFVFSDIFNSAAHHSAHHLYFSYNFGQYFTFWDKLGGTYKSPEEAELRKVLRTPTDRPWRTKKGVEADRREKKVSAVSSGYSAGECVKIVVEARKRPQSFGQDSKAL